MTSKVKKINKGTCQLADADSPMVDSPTPTRRWSTRRRRLADMSTRRRVNSPTVNSPMVRLADDKNMYELLSASRPSASRTIGELTVGELTRRRVDMSASRRRRVDHRRVGVGELNCSHQQYVLPEN
ncbi:hypothetical protein GPALN_013112 [Globodera pallida]|nr:hypothetical protein GPALN_013112 [Globodera pallida]